MMKNGVALKDGTDMVFVREVARFKVWPGRKGFDWERKRVQAWWSCHVLKDLRDVNRAYGRKDRRRFKKGYAVTGFVRCNDSGKPDQDGCLGQIFLPSGKYCGNQLASHEATHAGIFFCNYLMTGRSFWEMSAMRRFRIPDEFLALAVGNSMHFITGGLLKCGVWGK